MAGNEKAICEFLYSHMGSISLKHIGLLVEIGIPLSNRPAQSLDDVSEILTEVVGIPRVGWRDEVYEVDRKTVYFLMIEKKK